ncbi:hypothetical protein P12x_000524 [Tundrisphaera lichenicola]|uniref:hypothetical protein n=1 Tax=Tundrisphaera lichenicola TaxID=2029860 RepID=UPI003EB91224
MRFSNSRDPDYRGSRNGPRYSFFARCLGLFLILFASYNLVLFWGFSTMVEPGLEGLDWWAEVTSKPGFLAGSIFFWAMLLGGLRLLSHAPRS